MAGSVKVRVRSKLRLGRVRAAIEKIDSRLKLLKFKIRDYEPNVSFSFSRGKFTVKTADNGTELADCLKLRFEVFHREYMQKRRKIGVDVDAWDFRCDHLMVIESESNKLVGTYRLNSSLFTNAFYSASEFEINGLLKEPGNKLELGRACIQKEYRTGVVIALLWRGVAQYAKATDTSLIFGCTSIKTVDPLEIGRVTKYIAESVPLEKKARIQPTKKFRVKRLDKVLRYIDENPGEYDPASIKEMIPALFSSYVNLGAQAAAEPALDREFGCIDFLTVLKFESLTPAVKGKYKV